MIYFEESSSSTPATKFRSAFSVLSLFPICKYVKLNGKFLHRETHCHTSPRYQVQLTVLLEVELERTVNIIASENIVHLWQIVNISTL